MDLKIKEIKDRGLWNDFVTSQKNHSFLHSWEWGEFNQKIGDSVRYLGLWNKSELISVALVIKVNAKRGSFLFIPHGPILRDEKNNQEEEEILRVFLDQLKRLAKKEKVSFIRISPLLERNKENQELFKNLGFRNAPIHMHAEVTWTTDIDKDEEDILMGMRKTTRNLVRRAQKDGVVITADTSDQSIENFYELYRQTARRHSFVPFSKKYIDSEVSVFSKASDVKVYSAIWGNKLLSTSIIVFFGHSAFYHHGANSIENQKIPAAYLLQWQAMQEAKNRGKKYYNFWGIAENEEDKSHPWHGLTFFKKGFGGYRTEYLQAQDLPISKKYWFSYFVDRVRKFKRGV